MFSAQEIDVLCQALNEAASNRQASGTENDLKIANVYEAMRKQLRRDQPMTASMMAVMEQIEEMV